MTKLFNSSISNQNLRYSKQTNRRLVDSNRKLASGSRITRAADDAAGLSISSKLTSTIRSKGQAVRNTNDAFSVLQVMEGSLNELSSMVIRLRELAIASISETYSDRDRKLMSMESSQILNEIQRIAEGTEYMGHKVFSAENTLNNKFEIQVDTKGDENNKITIDLSGLAQTPYALGISDVMIDTQHRAKLSLVKLDYALSEITKSRTQIGATTNRLNSTVDKLNTDIENQSATNSKIKDVDYATETAEQVKAKLLQSSQVAVQSQINYTGRQFLKLLK